MDMTSLVVRELAGAHAQITKVRYYIVLYPNAHGNVIFFKSSFMASGNTIVIT